jgi:hypothetical protein
VGIDDWRPRRRGDGRFVGMVTQYLLPVSCARPEISRSLLNRDQRHRTTQDLCMHILTKLCRHPPNGSRPIANDVVQFELDLNPSPKPSLASASFRPAHCAPRTTDRPPCRADTPSQSPSRRSASCSVRPRSRAPPCGTFAHPSRDPRACEPRVSTLLSGWEEEILTGA